MSDAYNTEGYWDYLTVRGFVLDNRFNFRRDGLPISAETSIPLDNKSRIEILKGTSGMQAGTSAPGGLVNYVVKRPLDSALRSAAIEWRQRGSVTASLDLSQRFGAADAFGLRVNAAAAHLDPQVRDRPRAIAACSRWPATGASSRDTLHRGRGRDQPPLATQRAGLQPARATPCLRRWTRASTSTTSPGRSRSCSMATPPRCAGTQRLADDWRSPRTLATQRLRTDDRIAFPFGCTTRADGTYYADRYCPDGSFDLYDFRSDNERRRTDALDVSLQGRVATGGDRPRAHRGRAVQPREEPLPAPGLQLRRHRQCGWHRHHPRRRPTSPTRTPTATSAAPSSTCAMRSR